MRNYKKIELLILTFVINYRILNYKLKNKLDSLIYFNEDIL